MNQTYIIKPGDTLYGISNQFGVSVSDILNINSVNPNNLQVGQTIIIPATSGTNPSDMFIYTVKKGDSLYSISKKYNTTVSELTKLNNLKSTNLSIGQTIIIPEYYDNNSNELPLFTNYTVKKGDTLYSIAKNYNISVDDIIKDNNLISNTLSINQIIKIRKNGITNETEVLECFGDNYQIPELNNTFNYIVKKGDSLYKIASKYNTSVSEIMNLNNLKSTNLTIGQVLKIPGSDSNTITYIVKKGDSLYGIAKKYNTTVDSIKKKNNISSNILTIGQQLII